jgi:hypothetical protein
MNIGSLYHVLLGERGPESLSHFMYVLHVPAEKIIQVIGGLSRTHLLLYSTSQSLGHSTIYGSTGNSK